MFDIARMKAALRHLPSRHELDIHERVELSAWTTLRIGGPADLVIRCHSAQAAADVLGLVRSEGQGWFVLGAGSNVVLPDDGMRVPVITLGGDLSRWEVDFDGVVTGAAANLTQVCRSVARAGLTGIEGLFGIPGSVGGAIIMNAGAYGVEIFDVLDWVEVVRPGEAPVMLRAGEISHGYRTTSLGGSEQVVVRARLELRPGDLASISGRTRDIIARRRVKLPGQPSAGSVFKNPEGKSAGQLLQAAGCTGLRVGGARVWEGHANVIVTSPRASASDILRLARQMREMVRDTHGIELEPEVRFVDPRGGRIEL